MDPQVTKSPPLSPSLYAVQMELDAKTEEINHLRMQVSQITRAETQLQVIQVRPEREHQEELERIRNECQLQMLNFKKEMDEMMARQKLPQMEREAEINFRNPPRVVWIKVRSLFNLR